MVSFVQALKNKYCDQQEIEDVLILPKDDKISTRIVLVGFGKVSSIQKQLTRLINIDLSNCNIDSAGDFKELEGCLNRLRIVNLSNNSLDWDEVVAITDQLPQLKELILTNNKSLKEEGPPLKVHSKQLLSLTLGRIPFWYWTSVVDILSKIHWTVKQLDLWNCQLDDDKMFLLYNDDDAYEFVRKLETLKLSQNNYLDIKWMNQIGPIENLIELDLSKCKLSRFSMDHQITKLLSNLVTLNISCNDISNWESISILHKLKNLKNLICHENPLYLLNADAKSLTIGRLGQIVTVNREEITPSTRRDSEVLYIRRSFQDFQLYQKGEYSNFKTIHPRYEQLVEHYGIPEDLLNKQVIDKYVNVELCHQDKKITKKLPCDMRIANLKMLCKKLFRLRPSINVTIICREPDQSNNNLNYELDKDGQTLHFFSVRNGHRLIIEELD